MGVSYYKVGDYVIVRSKEGLMEGIVYANDGSIVYLENSNIHSSYITLPIVEAYECLAPFLGKAYGCIMANDDRVEPYNTCIGGE